ncbi:MAG: polysaccharide deacetylase family protein [Candidatus Thiodiazotropha sp.]
MNITQFAAWLFLLIASTQACSKTAIKSQDLTPVWHTGWKAPGYTADSFSWTRFGTLGNGNANFAAASFSSTDLRRKIINFKCRFNSLEALKGFEIRFSNNKDFKSHLSFNIPLYDTPGFNIIQPNEWHNLSFGLGNAVTVGNPDTSSIQYVGVYYQDKGSIALSLDISDISITESSHNPILSYTFDDGYVETLAVADILSEYKQAATAYIIPDGIDEPNYLTLDDVDKLVKLGWGISSHDTLPFTQRTPDELNKRLNVLNKYFQDNNLQKAMRHLAYPQGEQNRSYVVPLVRSMYDTARTAGGGMETLPPGDFALLRAYNVLNTTSVEELHKQVVQAKKNNQWLILMFHYFHDPESPAETPLSFDINKFRQFVEIVSNEGITVTPVHQVYEMFTETKTQ